MGKIFKDKEKDELLDIYIALGVVCLFGLFIWKYGFSGKDVSSNIGLTDLSTEVIAENTEVLTHIDTVVVKQKRKITKIKEAVNPAVAPVVVAPMAVELDTDKDGVADNFDKCPTVAGALLSKGCPDSDSDGIADNADNCPNESGIVENNGCPEVVQEVEIVVVDTDGDGVEDEDDKCPELAGTIQESGCPEIKLEESERKLITETIKNIQFETGSDKLTTASKGILRSLSTLMKKYPDYNLTIAGHTDNRGGVDRNLELSKERAASCAKYLNRYGVDSSRISHNGYGDAKPIASNESSSGRKKNRRVEFKLGY